MAAKTDTEVIIGGRVITLSGFESEEYLQKVASYLNSKLNECSQTEGFRHQPIDMQSIMVQLNISDDYFKAKRQIEELQAQLEEKDKELYDLKHELIATQIKQENTEKKADSLKADLDEANKKLLLQEALQPKSRDKK
ncbi:MAG: cell division protein ZapA [Lachnospiraceae bacterium]|jgi:cell division protein ZapA|nr:cell division protein ZapA [Lachnospiraceae bacterium]